jgi:hypothetical protein
VAQCGYAFRALFNAVAGENLTARRAAIWIVSPVAGLRPSRAERSATLNLPKPATATSPLPASSAVIASNHTRGGRASQPRPDGDLPYEILLGHPVHRLREDQFKTIKLAASPDPYTTHRGG